MIPEGRPKLVSMLTNFPVSGGKVPRPERWFDLGTAFALGGRMQRRLIGIVSVAVVYGLSAAACGQVEADGGGSGGAAGSGAAGSGATGSGATGSGAASGLAGNAGDVEYSGECSAEVVDSNCGDSCPITTDLLVRCEVEGFGVNGLRVAPRPDEGGVYLATGSFEHAWFATLAAGGNVDFEDLPQAFEYRPIRLTLSPEGLPSVAIAERYDEDVERQDGVVVCDPLDNAPDEQFVDAEGGEILAFEYDAAGSLHVAHQAEAIGTAARAPGGAFATTEGLPWLAHDVPLVTADGQWVALRFSDQADASDLEAHTATDVYPLMTLPGPARVFPAPPALPPTGDVPAETFVVGLHSDEQLFVLESHAGEVKQLALDLPSLPSSTCLDGFEGSVSDTCPAGCEDVRHGAGRESLALAQTSDGRVWAAWVHRTIDESHTYQQHCWTEDGAGCACAVEVTRNDTHAEIVLMEVDPEQGTTREVFRLPSQDVAEQTFGDDQVLDLRAFGRELALGVHVLAAAEDRPHHPLRVLEIDTARIEGL